MEFSLPLVFGAGVLSFLSPCVLPLVPPYLTYMSGASFDQLRDEGTTAGALQRRVAFTSLFFILGFTVVFVTLGATATAFGQAFRQALPILTPVGLAFAIGWTPCIGPVLAAVLSVAASKSTAWEGAGLLGLYSLGLGVPFFLAGIAVGPFLAFFQGFKRHLHTVERVMGGLLVLTGILFLTGNFTRLSYWFLETFPALANFG